jgi:hypothetical protein
LVVRLAVALGKEDIPRAVHVGDGLARARIHVGVSVLTGLIFGSCPRFILRRPNLVESLKEGGRGTGEGARRNPRAVCWSFRAGDRRGPAGERGTVDSESVAFAEGEQRLQPENVLTFNSHCRKSNTTDNSRASSSRICGRRLQQRRACSRRVRSTRCR